MGASAISPYISLSPAVGTLPVLIRTGQCHFTLLVCAENILEMVHVCTLPMAYLGVTPVVASGVQSWSGACSVAPGRSWTSQAMLCQVGRRSRILVSPWCCRWLVDEVRAPHG